jgi:hypothetical protein
MGLLLVMGWGLEWQITQVRSKVDRVDAELRAGFSGG